MPTRVLLAVALLAPGAASAALVEKLTVIEGGEDVGHVIGTTEADRVEVDFHVDNNGRGPKHRETLRLDRAGIPLEWTVSGTSLMGGPVEERFRWADGRASWVSQADRGEVAVPRPRLYVVNDDSPWALGVYARALLKAPGQRLDVLPSGTLRLETVRAMRIGQGRAAVPVTIYRLQGIGLEPALLMLDDRGRLFAQFDDKSAVVREGYEAEAPALLKLGSELEVEAVRALQQQLAHRGNVPVRIRNVRVFDPAAGTLSAPSTVIVMRERVVGVLPLGEDTASTPGELVIDGEGGTLLPGLHDMHSHATLRSGLFYLAAGVTGTRDQGNVNDFLLDLMPRIEAGEIAGPRIVPNGFIEGRSPFSARLGTIPEREEEALRAVDWYADRGYRQIKIYNSMTPHWVARLAARAHARGLKVSGHVPAFMSPDQAVLDGYDDIAHVNQLMLGWLLQPSEDTRTLLRLTGMARGATLDLASPRVRRTVELMKSRGVALDTTAVILERLMTSRAGSVADGDADYLDHVPIGYQRYRKRTFVPLASAEEDAQYLRGFAKVLEVLKLLHDKGIQLLPGTDDGTGFTVHREVELYAKAGIPPATALRLATLDAARYLGLDHDTGTIERGKYADFMLLPGDPLQDLRQIRRARLVMKGGTIYYPSEIYEALAIRPFSSPPPVQAPRQP
ncbi:MAG: amidohydrolase family protein [Gammaproteobacteria bacterium]|nr:amidohydrolase family protein [Gammaproteobacteria bacterium]